MHFVLWHKIFEGCTRTLVTKLRYGLSQNAFQPLIQRTTTCIMFCDTYCLEGCSGPFRITQPTQTCALSTMVAVNLLRHVIPTAHECLAGVALTSFSCTRVACECLNGSYHQLLAPCLRTSLRFRQLDLALPHCNVAKLFAQ